MTSRASPTGETVRDWNRRGDGEEGASPAARTPGDYSPVNAKPSKRIFIRDRVMAMLKNGSRLTTLQMAQRLNREASAINHVLNDLAREERIEKVAEGLRGEAVWRVKKGGAA